MSRGKKLDLFIGADIGDGWAEVQISPGSKISNEILEPSKHQLYFSKEKRRGKTVTLVGVFRLSDKDAKEILKKLKKKLGCGGAFKDGFMEFQGDIKDSLREYLTENGFTFKPKH
ncbi:MAG: translation initiation factor [Campylobacterales bacterium]|nr:translation initiation factor [Campylobacterales bacterium]